MDARRALTFIFVTGGAGPFTFALSIALLFSLGSIEAGRGGGDLLPLKFCSSEPRPSDVTDTDFWLSVLAPVFVPALIDVEREGRREMGRAMPEMPISMPEEAEVARLMEEALGREARAELGREVEVEPEERPEVEELRERPPGSLGALGALTVSRISIC